MEFKNWHLKGSKHTGLFSFLSPYQWLGCGSMHPPVSENVRPVQPCRTPGETGCGLTCSMLSSSTAAAASQAAQLPRTPFGVSAPVCSVGAGLGSPSYRTQMDCWWCLLPISPTRAGRKGEGDRCFYVPLVAPTSSPASAHTHALALISAENWRKSEKGKEKQTTEGMAWRAIKGHDDVMEWKLV